MKKFNTIWLIDDDEIFRFSAEQLMEMGDFTQHVVSFENGEEALQAIDKLMRQEMATPDLIFLDVNMPVLDGWQFLDELSKYDLPTDFKIYMLSSSADMADMSQVAKYPLVQKYLLKPISLNLLSEVS
jgi:CheY-like chemotaxis protein